MPIISKRKDKNDSTGEHVSPDGIKEKKKEKKKDLENPLLSEPPPRMSQLFEFTKDLNKDRVFSEERIGNVVIFDSTNGQEYSSVNKKQDLLFKKLRNER